MRKMSAHLAEAGAVISDEVPVGCRGRSRHFQDLVVVVFGVPVPHDDVHQHQNGIPVFMHQRVLAKGPGTL